MLMNDIYRVLLNRMLKKIAHLSYNFDAVKISDLAVFPFILNRFNDPLQ